MDENATIKADELTPYEKTQELMRRLLAVPKEAVKKPSEDGLHKQAPQHPKVKKR